MRILSLLCCVFFIQISLCAQEIGVMTYNIKYANENDGENSWSKRKDWITKQIRFYEPDVLGVQEALKSQLDHFTDNTAGYKVLGVGRDGQDKGEYSAILYKQEKFEVLKSDTFWLSETPDKISKGWDAALNRVCTYALFEDKASKKKFWIFNTHFDHMGEKARLESSRLIVQKIKMMTKEDHPVLLMGDFNLEPETKGVEVILDYLDDSKKEAEFTFGPTGTFNGYNFSEPVTRRIDYIFINDKVEVEKYAVISDSKDLKYPSDHLPVLVKAKLLE